MSEIGSRSDQPCSTSGPDEDDLVCQVGSSKEFEMEDVFLDAFAAEDEEDPEPEMGDFWFPNYEEFG